MNTDLAQRISSASHDQAISWLFQLYGMLEEILVGNEVQCPFCGRTFARFLPHGERSPVLTRWNVLGGGYRDNAICPECFSLDRERLIYLYLRDETDVFSGALSVLHMAPETCLSKVIRDACESSYISADLDPKGVMCKVDVTNIDFTDESFDVVICNHVLEHVEDDRQAMAELHRVLKRGGFAILQVPISWDLPQTHENPKIRDEKDRLLAFGQADHVRIYGADYPSRLTDAGFSVELFNPASENRQSRIRQNGLLPGELVVVARKLANHSVAAPDVS